MGLKYARWYLFTTPFRDYPIEGDVLVENVLVIEVQSEYFHSKSTRQRKDDAKLKCFEAMGLGCLWLYDDELRYAFQKKRGSEWKPLIKQWILTMLDYSRSLRARYLQYMELSINVPMGTHPEYGRISLRGDARRQ